MVNTLTLDEALDNIKNKPFNPYDYDLISLRIVVLHILDKLNNLYESTSSTNQIKYEPHASEQKKKRGRPRKLKI